MPHVLLLLFLFTFGKPGFALTVDPEQIQLALDDAPLIAEIEVTDRNAAATDNNLIVSTVRATVLGVRRDANRSLFRGQSIEIVSPGGEVGDVGIFLSGYPRPRVGRRYEAYLRPLSEGSTQYQIVGLEKGLVAIDGLREFTRNRTDGSDGAGSGPFLYWDDSYFPVPYVVSRDSFRDLPGFIQAVDSSFQTWRNPDNVMVEFLPLGCSSSNDNQNDGINNIILITSNWPFDTLAIAITRNFYIAGNSARAGLILDSDILLNSVDHSFTVTAEAGKHDVQNIVTHEVGHFIGLGHESTGGDNTAVMFANAATEELEKRTLKDSDMSGLRDAYFGTGAQKNKTLLTSTPSCVPQIGNNGCARISSPGHSSVPGPFIFWVVLLLFLPLTTRWVRRLKRL